MVPGVRVALAALFVFALAGVFRGVDHAAGPVMALVFAAVYGVVLWDWREPLRVAFAPDAGPCCALADLGRGGRLGLMACRLVPAWFFWTCATAGIIPHGGLIAFLPLGAFALERFRRARRPSRL
jgi:hypothetical protein